ncbi:MAG TPA: DUF1937 family protein [Planctomycetaceae bacterium]|nr:DUF1937 family protein [Planctomycetaceae bacterium]
MIYLASPYSHPNPHVREQRFEAVCRVAAELIRAGHSVFSPIAQFHPIAKYGLPTDWEFWERHCREQISRCDELVVVKLDGWERSVGVQAEIGIAKEHGKTIAKIFP